MSMSAVRAGQLFELAAAAGPGLAADPKEYRERLAACQDELPEAIRWFIGIGDAGSAVAMAANLHGFWLERSQVLGRELSAAVLAMPEAARTARYAELKVGWAGFVFFTGLPAGEAYESALAAASERGDAASEVGALVGRGRVAVRDGRWDDLRAAALVALDVAKATGDRALQRGPLHCLAGAARVTGDYPQARKWYWESIEISNALGLVTRVPGEYHNLGWVELQSGDVAAAERMFRLALDGAREFGLAVVLPYCVFDFAALAITRGALERGAVLAAAAQAAREASDMAPMPDEELQFGPSLRTLREQLDPGRLAELTRRGRELSLDAALSLADHGETVID
jgi:tetratricopeptide (TPR) repeat protein